MSEVDRIYQKYIGVFYEVDGGGTWIDLSAVRYALRAALRELAGTPTPNHDRQGGFTQRQYEVLAKQIERLNDWLFEHAPDLAHEPYTDTADAIIAVADRLRGTVERMRIELATAIDERNAADAGCAEAEATVSEFFGSAMRAAADTNAALSETEALRQQLIALDADNARLVKELATLRSYVTAPKVDATNGIADPAATSIAVVGKTRTVSEMIAVLDAANGAPALAWPDDLADWVEGLDKGRHDWRKLAKSVRWQLIANVVNQVKDSVQFDLTRPAWMSTSRAAALTFGDGKWETVVKRAHSGEVVL